MTSVILLFSLLTPNNLETYASELLVPESTEPHCDVIDRMLAKYDALNPPALQELLSQGVELQPFPEDVMRRAEEVTADLLQSQASGALYSRIHEAYRRFRETSNRWFSTAEHAYASFVYDRTAYSDV